MLILGATVILFENWLAGFMYAQMFMAIQGCTFLLLASKIKV